MLWGQGASRGPEGHQLVDVVGSMVNHCPGNFVPEIPETAGIEGTHVNIFIVRISV